MFCSTEILEYFILIIQAAPIPRTENGPDVFIPISLLLLHKIVRGQQAGCHRTFPTKVLVDSFEGFLADIQHQQRRKIR